VAIFHGLVPRVALQLCASLQPWDGDISQLSIASTPAAHDKDAREAKLPISCSYRKQSCPSVALGSARLPDRLCCRPPGGPLRHRRRGKAGANRRGIELRCTVSFNDRPAVIKALTAIVTDTGGSGASGDARATRP